MGARQVTSSSTSQVSAELQAPSGFKNLGNTCYMNAALQCLLQTQDFNSLIFQSSQATPLTESYITLYRHQKTVRQLLKLKKEMKKENKHFGGFKQMDANEFLLYFFTRICATIPELKSGLEQLFAVESTTQLVCKTCKATIRSNSQQLSLLLPLLPAKLELTIHPGNLKDPEVLIETTEQICSTQLLEEVKNKRQKTDIWLVLQTQFDLVRVISTMEPLQKMDLLSKHLYYYEVGADECLVEMKVYRKGFIQKQLVRLLVTKCTRTCDPLALRNQLRDELEATLKVQIVTITTQTMAAGCLFFSSNIVSLESADLASLLHSDCPVLRVQVVIDALLGEGEQVPLKVKRSAESMEMLVCLNNSLAEEPFTEKIRCDTCESVTDYSKSSIITKLSKYLVVSLQRYNPLDGSKDTRLVTFPIDLDLGYVNHGKYRLYAVVRHHGIFFTSGHYTSCVLFRDKWYLCNDSSVLEIASEDLILTLQTDAYLLFYAEI